MCKWNEISPAVDKVKKVSDYLGVEIKELIDQQKGDVKTLEKSRYSVLDSSGKATIVERKDGRYIDIEEMAQHVAFNVLDDYSKILNGEKKIDETNIRLSINVLNAVAPLAKYFRTGCAYGKDQQMQILLLKLVLLPKFLH